MRYNTRHGFSGYDRQIFPRAEKLLLAGYLAFTAAITLIYVFGA